MGSGLAPGGAGLFAAHMEQVELEKRSSIVRAQFNRQVLSIRWVDNLIFCRLRILDPVIRVVLRGFQKENFYGEGLKLEKQRGNEAFGFIFYSLKGNICVKQCAKYLDRCDVPGILRKWRNVQGPMTFQTDRVTRAVIVGHFTRVLDMSNCDGATMSKQIMRLIWELRSLDFPEKVVAASFNKVRTQMWSKLPGVEGSWDVSPTTAFALAVCADVAAAVFARLGSG